MREPRNFTVVAIHQIASAAGDTDAAMSSIPADAHALAFFPSGNRGTDLINHAGNFVAGHQRVLQAGPLAFYGHRLAVANPARVRSEEHTSELQSPVQIV